jgi:hypothetical protein
VQIAGRVHGRIASPARAVPEVTAVLVATSRAVEHAAADPALRERTITVLLDGLRPRTLPRRRR